MARTNPPATAGGSDRLYIALSLAFEHLYSKTLTSNL